MSQLIRVGNKVINLTHVVSAEIADGTVTIRFAAGPDAVVTFEDAEAEALARIFNDSRFVHSTNAVEAGVRRV